MIEDLKKIVGPKNVLSGGAEKERFSHVWATDIPLSAKGVVLPSSTEQVSEVLRLCYQHHEEVVVHGGLTNLVGGTQTNSNQWVVSLERMNAIEEIDIKAKTVTAQAGVVLAELIDAVAAQALFLPLHFGAKGSAQIGGVVATNAGGMRVFRYGMTRNLVLGMEVVLPTGVVLSSLKKIIKDNSGYDLKQLFIGAEGTLGIITKVSLRLFELPTSRYAALVALKNFNDVIRFLRMMQRELSGNLSAFELMWQATYQKAAPKDGQFQLSPEYPYYVFVECLGHDLQKDYRAFEDALALADEKKILLDGVLAQSEREVESLMRIREDTQVLRESFVSTQHFDISLPIDVMDKEVERIVADLEQLPFIDAVLAFGHIADGNLHLVVGKNETSPVISKTIESTIYKNLKKYLGSVSAEHGIGVHKKAHLKTSKSPEEIALMKTLKQAVDPKNLLNPGRIF